MPHISFTGKSIRQKSKRRQISGVKIHLKKKHTHTFLDEGRMRNNWRECGVQKTGFMPPEKIIRKQKKKRGTGRKRTLRQAFELVSFSASGACDFLILFASHILMLSYSYGASAILKLPSNRVCCGCKWCKLNFNVLRVHGMCRCWQKVNLPANFHAWVIMLICWNIWMRLVLNDEGECCVLYLWDFLPPAEAVQPVVESGESSLNVSVKDSSALIRSCCLPIAAFPPQLHAEVLGFFCGYLLPHKNNFSDLFISAGRNRWSTSSGFSFFKLK